ncbi:AtzE family amidohydrolase [Lichenicola cladoniae]|uniref:AtzE family amidohydrolase n=1 Tax=Lichenicola cladoniae TaxID=1484109 RepID=A0A6M8HNM9_9PROT|nr:AtzE family amidohydrolase [Lichenicola cladoniae]NPD67419.1 AtzE family amidohydrolase [Acetobacteraceae bacterium]QKE89910.1 AtzE family amidohydrolase [Lichenicola cladoniae]
MIDATVLADGVRTGRWSAVELVRQALDRIGRHDPLLNCFTHVRSTDSLDEAAASDAARARGEVQGPLAGVPFAVKNLFDVAGHTTIAGSRVLAGHPPAERDATIVARLRQAGAILLGQLNMDEFAYGFSTENSHYGTTANPHDPDCIAGGSSGGSAAAVAAGLVALSLGSDTNGSIRVPASLCGVFGLKPTYGRLSRAGAFPFVASLDHVGPFARSVRDLALAYELMQGADDRDPVMARRGHDPALAGLGAGTGLPPGFRVGVLQGWFRRGASDQALAAVDHVAQALARAGAIVEPAVLEDAETARSAAFVMTGAEGGALHLPWLATDAGSYDPAVRDRLIAGAMIPASVVIQAQRVRSHFRAQVARLFETTDLLLAPATPFPAVRRGHATIMLDGKPVSARANMGLYTQPISFVGLPVVNVPIQHEQDRLPIGVQVITRPWAESLGLRVAAILERDDITRVRELAYD